MPATVVEPLSVSETFVTQVYTSSAARKGIAKECDDPRRLMKKLKEMAREGFEQYPVGRDCLIQNETGCAIRLRHSASSLFRIIGFFHGPSASEFIAPDALMKHGRGYTPSQRRRIEWVSMVERNDRLWRKGMAT